MSEGSHKVEVTVKEINIGKYVVLATCDGDYIYESPEFNNKAEAEKDAETFMADIILSQTNTHGVPQ